MVQLMPLHAETPSSIVSFKLRLIRLEGCELTCCWFISPPAVLLSFKKNIFRDCCQTNYLNIYWTDLHEICTVGRALAVDGVDEPSEVIFRSLTGRFRGNLFCEQNRPPVHTL